MVTDILRDHVGVPLHDTRRDPNVFRVGAVIEEQIFAEVFQASTAEETVVARRRICGHHPLARAYPSHSIANGDYIAGQLMPEDSWWHDHSRMIAAAENFDIGATSQRYFHAHQNVFATNLGNGDPLYLQVFLAVEYGSHH